MCSISFFILRMLLCSLFYVMYVLVNLNILAATDPSRSFILVLPTGIYPALQRMPG